MKRQEIKVDGDERIDLSGIALEHGKENVIRQLEDVNGVMNKLHPEEAYTELEKIMDRECYRNGLEYNPDIPPRYYRRPSGRYGMIAVLRKYAYSMKDPMRNLNVRVPNVAQIFKRISRVKKEE